MRKTSLNPLTSFPLVSVGASLTQAPAGCQGALSTSARPANIFHNHIFVLYVARHLVPHHHPLLPRRRRLSLSIPPLRLMCGRLRIQGSRRPFARHFTPHPCLGSRPSSRSRRRTSGESFPMLYLLLLVPGWCYRIKFCSRIFTLVVTELIRPVYYSGCHILFFCMGLFSLCTQLTANTLLLTRKDLMYIWLIGS